MPPAFERAQICHRDGKCESQLLRFRSAGIVDGAAVCQNERALEAAVGEVG